MQVPFNKPLVLGTEAENISKVLESGKLAGNGGFTSDCHEVFKRELGFKSAFLTTSCTSALELSALLLQIVPGDEVIVPSYAFVTTANAFASRGAKIVFCDSRADHPNIDENAIEQLITPKTKAIVALHYGGVPCQMEAILKVAKKHSIKVVEDNAQGIGSTINGLKAGGIGDFGAISFHETKNVHCGEGGAFMVNNPEFVDRAAVIWEMGTNRAEYRKGNVPSYGWVDIGSSFYPSELNAAFLATQLEQLGLVNERRLKLWQTYYEELSILRDLGSFSLPEIPQGVEHNAHTFFLITKSNKERTQLIDHLSKNGISASFHFQSLHKSSYFIDKHDGRGLPNADRFCSCLVRLPLYHTLSTDKQKHVISLVRSFYEK